jgi:hypothetical protein
LGLPASSRKLLPVNRLVLLGFAFASAGAAAVMMLSSCDANPTFGCVGGPCLSGTGTGGSGGGTGGAGDGGCSDAPQSGDYPCGPDGGSDAGDIFSIIHTHCHRCHNEMQTCTIPDGGGVQPSGAPFSLLTYADTQQMYTPFTKSFIRWKIMRQVVAGNPPPMEFGAHMPFGDAPQLDPTDLATLEAWLDSCAPPVPTGMGCACPEPGCTPIDTTCPMPM